jgi:hypothetical protein
MIIFLIIKLIRKSTIKREKIETLKHHNGSKHTTEG